MIEKFRQVKAGENRGVLLQWNYDGRMVQGYWPSNYESVDESFNGAALAVVNGMLAAGQEINDAVDTLKRTEDIYQRAGSAISRHVMAPWRNLREQSILARDGHDSALASLNQRIRPDGGETPLTGSVNAIERAEIRNFVNSFKTAADAYEFVMQSAGIKILDAVAPNIELTLFAKNPEMAERIVEEFHIRKAARGIANPDSDTHSTADAPLKNRMSQESIRALAKAEISSVKLKGELVADAAKLLKSVVTFTHNAMNLNDANQAFDFLLGRNIERPTGGAAQDNT